MRSIPSELLEKVNKKWQVPATDAEPEMKVYLSKGFLNELFQVFTIQEGAELTDVDVTVKRVDTAAVPAKAYAMAINNGEAEIKSKVLPYDDQHPWEHEFYVESGVSAVAIEFDGYWDRDYKTRRFNFVTEDVPWVFYVKNGSLRAQYWQDEDFELSTDVSKVSVIRGWLPVNGDASNDQGLIVAYIKSDGLMYYRSYCYQDNGLKSWETERPVAVFTGTIANLALFRTNDFRVGFIAEIAGETWWTLSTRNFAGMSVWPENISASILNVDFGVTRIYYTNTIETESITSTVAVNTFNVCTPIYPSLILVGNSDAVSIEVKFSHDISGNAVGHQGKFTLKDQDNINYAIGSTVPGGDTKTIVLKCANVTAAKNNMTLTYTGGLTSNNDGCEFPIPAFIQSFFMTLEPIKAYTEEYLTTSLNAEFAVTEVFYTNAYLDHSLTASIIASFAVTQVGSQPL